MPRVSIVAALLCALVAPTGALTLGTSSSRRNVLLKASTSLASLGLAPLAANADAIADIAARSNAEALASAAQKKQQKEDGNFIAETAGNVGSGIIVVATLGVLGFGGSTLLSIKGKSDELGDMSRFTDPSGKVTDDKLFGYREKKD